MYTKLVILTVLICIQLCAAGVTSITRQKFKQDRFAIGLWVAPPADEKIDQRWRELSEAHFNLTICGYDPKVIEASRTYDIKAIFWAAHEKPMNTERMPTGPETWGYIIEDEPSVSKFAAVRERLEQVHQLFPGKLCYINLYPGYAKKDKQLQATSYDEYVAKFMKVVQPEVLSMDHYPRFIPGKDGRDEYCEDLAVMRKYSLQADVPFWNFFNTFAFGGHTDPTEAQIRWQVYSSLVYGAKGVLYFCYYTPRGKTFPRPAIIDRNDRKTRHYEEAQRINWELVNLGTTVMKLTSRQVRRVKGEEIDSDELQNTPLKAITNAQTSDLPLDLHIGVFSHDDGRTAVMIQNYYVDFTGWITLEWKEAASDIVEVDKRTGKELTVYDESISIEGTQISFAPGEGRLFLIKTSSNK